MFLFLSNSLLFLQQKLSSYLWALYFLECLFLSVENSNSLIRHVTFYALIFLSQVYISFQTRTKSGKKNSWAKYSKNGTRSRASYVSNTNLSANWMRYMYESLDFSDWLTIRNHSFISTEFANFVMVETSANLLQILSN